MPSFTRKAIMQSFMKLVDQRPINKVTIKDIVEDCGINRNTFYYHFSDIPALIEAIVQEEAAELFQTHPTITSYEECIRLAIQEIQKNKRAVLHIYNSSNRDIYEHYLMQVCQYIVETYLNTLLGDRKIDRQDREIIVTVYSCQCFGLFIDWLNNNLSDEFPPAGGAPVRAAQGDAGGNAGTLRDGMIPLKILRRKPCFPAFLDFRKSLFP